MDTSCPERRKWAELSFIGSMRFFVIAVSNNTNIIFAATSVGVFRSEDKGATWKSMTDGLPKVDENVKATQI